MHFNPSDLILIKRTFKQAENLVECFFRLGSEGFKVHKYDVKTLSNLKEHEIDERAFAQLCRYYYQKNRDIENEDNFHFFTICLQDDRILSAVERGTSFIKLVPLLLYIAAHELVHIVRFNSGQFDFNAPLEHKVQEEEKVHFITKNMLMPIADADLRLVLDCFNDNYHIGDIFN